MWSALISEEPGSLFVDGTAKILDHVEFDDIRKIKELLETLEEKAKLVRILERLPEHAGDRSPNPDWAREF